MPPGSLIYIGEEMKHTIHYHAIRYDPDLCESFQTRTLFQIPAAEGTQRLWIHTDGVHRVEPIQALGDRFGISPLTLEDILSTEGRPKLEELDQHLFIVIKMLYLKDNKIAYEHLSMILGDRFLLTFQEQPGGVFDPIRRRLNTPGGRMRNTGCDYLAYAILDAVVDNYLIVLDHVEEEIEQLESRILARKKRSIIEPLHALQQELIFLAKTFRNGKEVLSRIQRRTTSLIQPPTQVFLQDVYDHMIHASESLETQREVINSLDNLHFSLLNQRTNEITKMLTLFASIFLPLTFIAGIYGMNFRVMPELEWKYGYPAILVFMLTLTLVMVYYFRKNKWF